MTLEQWLKDIEQAVRAFGEPTALAVRHPPDRAMSRRVAADGFPGVLPLWEGASRVVGLLARPDVPPRTWPAVVLKDGQAFTIASDSRTVLPQYIVLLILSNLPRSAERLAGEWSAVEAPAFELHRLLGGTDESLRLVAEVLADPAARARFKYSKAEKAAFEEAHSVLLRRIDASPPFARAADWLDAALRGEWHPPRPPEEYGAWARMVLCLAGRLAPRQTPPATLPDEHLRFIVEGDAGVDSGVPVKPSWSPQLGGASSEATLVAAADLAQKSGLSGDEITDGIVRALVTEGTSYNGLAHAEAVVAADEGGDPVRAWHLLQSAAWWAARNTGSVPDAMLEGARSIATDHEWQDVRWVAERAAGGEDA